MPDLPDEVERIKFIREEIKFEHKQIADRLSPFVTAQSFVTTAFAISAQNADHSYSRFVWYAYWVVIPFGFCSAFLVLCAIGVGVYRLSKLRKMLFQETSEATRKRILPDSSPLAHYVSLLYAFGLPILMMFIWCIVFVIGIRLGGYEAAVQKLDQIGLKNIVESSDTGTSLVPKIERVPEDALPPVVPSIPSDVKLLESKNIDAPSNN